MKFGLLFIYIYSNSIITDIYATKTTRDLSEYLFAPCGFKNRRFIAGKKNSLSMLSLYAGEHNSNLGKANDVESQGVSFND